MIKINSFSSIFCDGPRSNQEDFICPISKRKDERILFLCDGMDSRLVTKSLIIFKKGAE